MNPLVHAAFVSLDGGRWSAVDRLLLRMVCRLCEGLMVEERRRAGG